MMPTQSGLDATTSRGRDHSIACNWTTAPRSAPIGAPGICGGLRVEVVDGERRGLPDWPAVGLCVVTGDDAKRDRGDLVLRDHRIEVETNVPVERYVEVAIVEIDRELGGSVRRSAERGIGRGGIDALGERGKRRDWRAGGATVAPRTAIVASRTAIAAERRERDAAASGHEQAPQDDATHPARILPLRPARTTLGASWATKAVMLRYAPRLIPAGPAPKGALVEPLIENPPTSPLGEHELIPQVAWMVERDGTFVHVADSERAQLEMMRGSAELTKLDGELVERIAR